MELGTYVDGRPLTYDPASGAFRIGSAPVTLDQVLAYDRAGQLRWVNPETSAWARQLGGTPAPPAGTPEVPGTTAVTQTAPPPFPSARAAAQAPPPTTTAGYGPPPGTSPGQAPLPSGGGRRGMSTGLIIGIIAVVAVVAVGGFLAYRSLSGKKDKPVAAASAQPMAAASAQPVAAATTPAATDTGSTGDTGVAYVDLVTEANTLYDRGAAVLESDREAAKQYFLDAADAYESAWKMSQSDPAVGTDYATALYFSGDIDGSIAQGEVAIKAFPDFQNAFFDLGVSYHAKANSVSAPEERESYLDAARDAYRRAKSIDPWSDTGKAAAQALKKLGS